MQTDGALKECLGIATRQYKLDAVEQQVQKKCYLLYDSYIGIVVLACAHTKHDKNDNVPMSNRLQTELAKIGTLFENHCFKETDGSTID